MVKTRMSRLVAGVLWFVLFGVCLNFLIASHVYDVGFLSAIRTVALLFASAWFVEKSAIIVKMLASDCSVEVVKKLIGCLLPPYLCFVVAVISFYAVADQTLPISMRGVGMLVFTAASAAMLVIWLRFEPKLIDVLSELEKATIGNSSERR